DHGGGLSGAEAYRLYGRHTAPILARVGGRLIWTGRPEAVVIGPGEERWGLAFIAEYPNAAAFIDMVRAPDYQAIVAHRQAALADSRLIRHFPIGLDEAFGA